MDWANQIRGRWARQDGTARFLPPSAKFDAIRTRARLASEPRPAGISGPPIHRLLGELEVFAAPLKRRRQPMEIALAAEPRVVMLLPGFATHPVRMRHMAQELERAGHVVKRWGLGVNLGPTTENFAALTRRVLALHRRHDEKIVLVGWSLGGVFAREIAKCHPDAVAKVVTMGSPFSGNPRANNAWRIYHLITGHSVEKPPVGQDIASKPPVPTVALWSPRDGIVSPRSSCGKKTERDRAVALRCSHLGFAYSDEAIAAVLRELETSD
jgi:pimeloyl-ACP methyl ester carboxylesterase